MQLVPYQQPGPKPKAKLVRLSADHAQQNRWQLFLRPQYGTWYTRELPRLDDAATIAFVLNLARTNNQQLALVLLNKWTLWVDEKGNISNMTIRQPGRPNPPFMTTDGDSEAFVFTSDLEPSAQW